MLHIVSNRGSPRTRQGSQGRTAARAYARKPRTADAVRPAFEGQ